MRMLKITAGLTKESALTNVRTVKEAVEFYVMAHCFEAILSDDSKEVHLVQQVDEMYLEIEKLPLVTR